MRNFTLEQYKDMSERFNKLRFIDKIRLIKENSDILILASDYNWWGVKVKDKEIQEELEDLGLNFSITNEWDYNEMSDLLGLLEMEITDI